MANPTPSNPTPPTDEQLLAFAAGELPAMQAQAIAAYLQRDAKAATMVAAYQSLRTTVQNDDGVAPPRRVIERVRAIFHSRASAAASAPGMLASWIESVDRFIATIIYDSRLQPAAVRFADPSAADRINLTFETDTGEVDVQAERMVDAHAAAGATNRWRVMGQISEPTSAMSVKRELALVQRGASTPIALIAADDHGAFTLDAPAGTYELLLRAGDRAIVLTPIELT